MITAHPSAIHTQRNHIRNLLLVVIAGLLFSGVTAFPIQTELNMLAWCINATAMDTMLGRWLVHVTYAVNETNAAYPFLAYGTDWLAFAHIVLAVLFIGPLRDPVRNIWVIAFGLFACVAIFPLAFIAGAVRGIPVAWRLIDCSFGLVGGVLLAVCYRKTVWLSRVVALSGSLV